MAPETWHGRAGAATDQYALAATYAELRLNRRPFQANDYAGIMIDHLQSQPILDPMPAPEQQVILRAMAKEPTQRYPSCVAMVQALAEASPNAVLSRRFGVSSSHSSPAQTQLPGQAHETMIRHEARTMQPGAPGQTNIAGPMPSQAGQPWASSASTPSSVHGMPTQQGPAKGQPPAQQPPQQPAYGNTLGQPDGPPPNLGQSLTPMMSWGGGGPPGSGLHPAVPNQPPSYRPPVPTPGTQPAVALPPEGGYPQQPGYAPQQGPYGTPVTGPDMFVEASQYGGYPQQPNPQMPPPAKSRLPLVAALIGLSGLILLGTAVGVWFLLQPKPKGGFALQKPADVRVKAGKNETVTLKVDRKGYQGPLKLTYSAVKNVTITGAEIPAGSSEVQVRFDVASLAEAKKYELTVTATPEQGEEQKIEWAIVVEGAGTGGGTNSGTAWLPEGYESLGTETSDFGGKRWYKQIQKKTAGGPAVVFCLIPAPTPFYLMQDKMSNEVFEAYVKATPGAVKSPWEKGGIANGADAGKGSKLPVFRITQAEAMGAAKWLGGTLPSPEQLDFAAAFEELRGAAVKRRDEGPAPVGSTGSDRSKHDIRDLAGNGWEWTNAEIPREGTKHIVLRGQRYTAHEALHANLLKQWQTEPFTCDANHASPLISFRVAILPPP